MQLWALVMAGALAGITAGVFAAEPSATQPTSIYDFTLNTIDGQPVPLSQYKGKTLLIVNVASKCGYTKQYAELEALYQQYKDKGVVVIGFPANNFKGQEPGTDAEIKAFCTDTYGVTFPMFSKISVKGEDIHPLYQYLTTHAAPTGDIGWNFEKFVIAPDGRIVARFKSAIKPLSEEITRSIQSASAM